MGDENNNGVSKVKKWITLAVGVVTLIAIISGGIWTMTNTFAMKTEVVKVKEEVEENINLIAQNILQTIQQDRVKSGVMFWQQQLELSHDRERILVNELQKRPNDSCLINQLQEEKRKQQRYQYKLDELLK